MEPFKESNSIDVLRGQAELLKRENALLKREIALQKDSQAIRIVTKESASLASVAQAAAKPVILLALIAASVSTGNGWFLVLIMLLAFD